MVRKMDKETMDKLRGLLPFSDKTKVLYTPECYAEVDIPDYYKPVFEMRGLTREEHIQLVEAQAQARASGGDVDNEVMKKNLSVARTIVTGWTNLYDGATGEEISFCSDKDGGADASTFYALHYTVHIAIVNKMFEISGLLPIERLSLK